MANIWQHLLQCEGNLGPTTLDRRCCRGVHCILKICLKTSPAKIIQVLAEFFRHSWHLNFEQVRCCQCSNTVVMGTCWHNGMHMVRTAECYEGAEVHERHRGAGGDTVIYSEEEVDHMSSSGKHLCVNERVYVASCRFMSCCAAIRPFAPSACVRSMRSTRGFKLGLLPCCRYLAPLAPCLSPFIHKRVFA